MTKLGITPGVHGEGAEEKNEDHLVSIKVDPKVFTILQPVNPGPITIMTPAPRYRMSRAIMVLFMFLAVGLMALLFTSEYYDSITPKETTHMVNQPVEVTTALPSSTTSEEPDVLSLALAKQQQDNRDNSNQQNSFPMPMARVLVIEGGSDNERQRNNVVDGSVEQQQMPHQMADTNLNAMPMHPEQSEMEARQRAMMEEMYMMRMRRMQMVRQQQAIMAHQMMREAMARQFYQQQQMAQQQQYWQAQAAARAQWEANRMEQFRMQQMRMQQMRMMEQARMEQQQQQEQQWQPAQPQWGQPQGQWAHPQPQWNQQQQPQQPEWYQRQQQGFPHPMQRQQMMWQQQQQQPQPQVMFLRAFGRALPMQNSQEIPMRPHDASPQQIVNNLIDAPQPAIHDRIYQKMQQRAQGMEFNAPSRPIWTAITPTPETPTTNYDQDSIFQENLKKALEQEAQQTTGVPSSTTETPEKTAEPKSENDANDDGVFRDIFSAMAEAAEKAETEPTTENVFKAFETDEDKQKAAETTTPAAVNAETTEAPKVEAATENVFKLVDNEKVAQSVPSSSEEKSEDMPPVEESATEPVMIEDSFPRLEERTTTSETPMASSESSRDDDDSEEHDPLAAFLNLRYFESEARKMAEQRGADKPQPTVVDHSAEAAPKIEGEGGQLEGEAQVDVPEPHFQPLAPRRAIVV